MLRFIKILAPVVALMTLTSAYGLDKSVESLYGNIPASIKPTVFQSLGAARKALQATEYASAAQNYNKAILTLNQNLIPAEHFTLECAGLANFHNKAYNQAIAWYEAALLACPLRQFVSPQNYMHLATAYYFTKQLEKSLNTYETALGELLKVDNNNPSRLSDGQIALVYFAAAEPAMDLNNWKKAANFFDDGLTLNPTQTANVYSNAGLAHLTISNWKKAAEYLATAIKLNPELPSRVYERLAQARINLEKQ